MSIEQRTSFFDKNTGMPLRDSEHTQIEKTAEKKEKIKGIIQEIENVYQLSTNLESVHRDAIRGFLAAIGTLLREEMHLLDVEHPSELAPHSVDVTTRELLKNSLSRLGIEIKGISEF